jgi:hypothetical protein
MRRPSHFVILIQGKKGLTLPPKYKSPTLDQAMRANYDLGSKAIRFKPLLAYGMAGN